ncbi:MAG: BREX-6 system BrxE protein [Planctomycetaceae bacterium]|nr:MAG: BREX-6 system BrxE protein [Planctomycetaceae bacterium]
METRKSNGPTATGESLTTSQIDRILSAQLIIAWAGEKGNEDEHRLGWWKSDFVNEFGGQDLFQQLLPGTWRWATFQAAREAARRQDRNLRSHDHNPDRLPSLLSLGFEIDERVEERLQDLKRSGKSPQECFPELKSMLDAGWSQEAFAEWLTSRGKSDFTRAPSGRRLKGRMPESLDEAIDRLIAAHAPLDGAYPLPHFRREP